MIQKGILNDLIKRFDIAILEQHLIHSFIENQKLDYSKSLLLSTYFKDFERNPRLYLETFSLDIADIKELENYLELLIPNNDRKVNGAFFTPIYIVDFIIKNVKPDKNSKCLDPTCGCGAFLLGLANYYRKTFGKSIKDTVHENIYGADILDYNIHRAKLLLTLLALQNNEIIDEVDFNLTIQDSLRVNWQQSFNKNPSGKFDKIVGNPPYVKFQDLSDENRKFLFDHWKTIKNGTFNLYFAFFELGYKLLKQNGSLGYITPNNYFTSLAGESLRRYFHVQKCITQIIDFNHRKVFDAQTYTAITFLDKKENPIIVYNRIEQGQEPEVFIKNANGSPNNLEELKIKKWRLLKTDEQRNIKTIETIGAPLNKVVNIFVGIATLKDELYFLDSLQKRNGYFLKTIYYKTFEIEPEITRQIYKISDFKSQEECNKNTRHIIFPYKNISGNAIPFNETEMKTDFPKCFEYFNFIKDKLDARDKGKSITVPFYAFGRSQGLTKTGKKILTPTFSKYPRFLIGEDKQAMYCNGYGIYFKDEQNGSYSLFNGLTNPLSKVENIDLLQKILNSYIMYYYVSKTSVAIEGGYPCYQKNFIEKFTIPEFSQKELDVLKSLSEPQEIDEFLIEKYQLDIQVPNLA
ncbi:MAG: SAM-dependent DNA methyltransferase [Bacteroidetes bacterium]|nr:SAM-dependent DNA methyltransferase [Bacteroidota bacterium]MBL7104864.1 SAM-dependent DNA methyltransferase [Bacteroidales bacterium]